MIHGGEIYGKKIEYDFSVNLNPCPCPVSVMQALKDAAGETGHYPDIYQKDFRERIAESEGVRPDEITGTNGASELLSALISYLHPKNVLLPVPSFYGYRHALNMVPGCRITEHDFLSDYTLGDDILAAIREDTDVLILGNPNNPTGKCIDRDLLRDIVYRCRDTGTALIVDECFLKLSINGSSVKQYIGRVPNIFIAQSYTKLFSIPGVRVGYCISDKENIEGLRRYLPEWNLSVYAEKAGIEGAGVLMDMDYLRQSLKMIEDGREELYRGFNELGIDYYLTDTSFILLKCEADLYSYMLDRGVLVRDCSNYQGLSKGYYRVAVKDSASNQVILKLLSGLKSGM